MVNPKDATDLYKQLCPFIFFDLRVLFDAQSKDQSKQGQSHGQDSYLFWNPKTHFYHDQNTHPFHRN